MLHCSSRCVHVIYRTAAVATTPGEHIAVIIGMFVGAGTFAYLVGAICGILAQVGGECRVMFVAWQCFAAFDTSA